MSTVHLDITPEERDTILAALRFFQSNGDPQAIPHIDDVTTNGAVHGHTDADEIDALCERTITSDEDPIVDGLLATFAASGRSPIEDQVSV